MAGGFDLQALLNGVLANDQRALGRAITLVENDAPVAADILDALYPHTGKARRIGITGPPGAGKSTLTAALIRKFREAHLSLGIVAVDPTSPFSGGAVLGDRVRMTEFSLDRQVFVRSMASRGHLGGLSARAQEVADVLDAAGRDIVLFETVGVGQTELDIAGAVDTTVVVLVPESGDIIQTMKAGLMEIADIFVVNKADRDGADKLARELSMALHLRIKEAPSREIPVLKTSAESGEGIEALLTEIDSHFNDVDGSGQLLQKRLDRIEKRIISDIELRLKGRFWNDEKRKALAERLPAVTRKELSPRALADFLWEMGNDK